MTLEIITSDLLAPTRHGFFTRRGGASSGIFAGLNCGPGSSDQAEVVLINRARVADAMEVDAEALVSLHQYHSAEVLTLSAPRQDKPKADAMVTATPGIGQKKIGSLIKLSVLAEDVRSQKESKLTML